MDILKVKVGNEWVGVPSITPSQLDVQVNGVSVTNNGIANIPLASTTAPGAVMINGYGLYTNSSSGHTYITKASSNQIKSATQEYYPIVPYNQHESAFYGLAKAAGDSTQAASGNAVGAYTDDAKTAIRTMIGAGVPLDVQINGISVMNNGVANIPVAGENTIGAIKVESQSASGLMVDLTTSGLRIAAASSNSVKQASSSRMPITPYYQHESVFYGLAKAAGDSTQASSSNVVGTYTEAAKGAIRNMLGVESTTSLVETISSTTPTIVGQPNVRYVCGSVTLIDITPPANGTMSVIFESGSTAAVLTVPNTVKFPAWFDATDLDTNTVYEIMITDGVYGAVMTWDS